MSTKEELMQDIISMEWEMFSAVNNVGGKADCQMKPKTFEIMRKSQMSLWNEDILNSYLEDLTDGVASGRNFMTEKYARMMEFSHPDEFAELKGNLPEIEPETLQIVNDIVAINIEWKEELDRKYPKLAKHGRPVRSSYDVYGYPSLETYMSAELKTYSLRTLRLLKAWTEERKASGINDAELNLLGQVKEYGYSSIEEAEQKIDAK